MLSVDSRKVPLYRFDVLVVGGGAAGAAAAWASAEAGVEVALLVKSDLEETNTLYAQGGMAAVLSAADSFEAHVADTLRVGCGLSERETVEHVVRGGPEAVERLVGWGACFDREPVDREPVDRDAVDRAASGEEGSGSFALSREGGHSRSRVVHRGDATGREIQLTVGAAIERHPRITTFARTFVVDLLCAADGRAVGALVLTANGDLAVFSGGQVILAAGGAGQIYRETTNPQGATGDGVAIGFRAGAIVRDIEFFQFHPTLLYIAGAARVLISETVRGAGGVLRDRDGVRFMPDHHPAAELAQRDVVSRAVFERMVATGDTSVYLDLSDVEGDPHQLFPGISRICHYFGIDIARDPVPVRPGAHYMIGGLEVDADGHTTVPGLWAVGECASSGLHGANRMGSNSLLECVVLGTRAGAGAARRLADRGIVDFEVRPPRDRPTAPVGMKVNITDVTYSLKSMMWRQLGVEREGAAMEDASAKIALWVRAVQELAPDEPATWELMNMLTVAQLTALGARVREESRGVHYRSDFPEADPAWCAHTRMRPVFEEGRVVAVDITRKSVPNSTPSLATA
ncbi:MAG: L-aspartate oxidase [Deltaproteobacteria bacterium]|nr:L-aspartate oxidase [Deltaproteobacteria bacterium]